MRKRKKELIPTLDKISKLTHSQKRERKQRKSLKGKQTTLKGGSK